MSSVVSRIVEPELLDSLSPNDPAAVRSRRDLRRVNWWMRNEAHVANAIAGLPAFPSRILELGAGDGTFMLAVAKRLQCVSRKPVQVYLLDMEPVIEEQTLNAFKTLGWSAEIVHRNVNDWLGAPNTSSVDLIVANLFLHHFTDEHLQLLFARLLNLVGALIACEPRRWKPALIGSRMLGLIGCNYVTRHDAAVSVRAGFRDDELSALWPANTAFQLRENPAGLASHLFLATKPV